MTLTAVRPVRTHAASRPPRRSRTAEAVLVVALVVVSGLLHTWNIFGYPYFENDEATYVARGWAFITQGQLDVNTYRYDHAPLGWMVIGSWLGLTGGGAVFGGMLEAGRVLMLLVHLANTLLVYGVAKRLAGGRITAGMIAGLVFALSPLGTYFQRRILLDNLMVFWVLLAIFLLLRKPLTLRATVASAIAFGIAVLTKLNAAFFGLGFLVLLWAGAAGAQRKHALLHWLAAAGGTVLLFFVYAMLNNELLPAPVGADGLPERVSLADTFALQLGRGDFAWPWDPASSFRQAIDSWVIKDWFTLVIGAVALAGLFIVLLARRFRDTGTLAILLFTGAYVAFLARGGIVLDLYVAPLVPFFAIPVGMLAAQLTALAPRGWMRPALGSVVAVALVAGYATTNDHRYLDTDETSNQRAAIAWIESEVPPDSVIVADNFVYPELAQEGSYADTMYFFNAEYDPELRERYRDDWRDIDYLVVTHEVLDQIAQGTVPKIAEVFEHADLVASFTQGTSSYIDLDARISTNGDWVQIYATKSRNEIVLQDAWQRFRDEWIVDYGQVLESVPGTTASLDQALAMEQALAQGDEATFRGVWQWTTDHMRHRTDDRLTSWEWLAEDVGEGELGSPDTVCAADQRFMGLLVEAAHTWDDATLRRQASVIAEDWWRLCTFTADGLRLVDSSADGSVDDRLINPSYFNPALYRALAEDLPDHDWQRLIDDGYAFLDRMLDERGTIPNWVVLTQQGDLEPAARLTGPDADRLGEDTLRLVPTLVREELAGEGRASDVIDALAPQVKAYAHQAPGVPAGVTLAMLAQVRDVGKAPESHYLDEVASRLDGDTGIWDVGLADFSWLYSWHRLQHAFPPAVAVPLI